MRKPSRFRLGFALVLSLLLCGIARAEDQAAPAAETSAVSTDEPEQEPAPIRNEDPAASAQEEAAAPAQEGQKVAAVEVDGNKIVSTATILTKIKTRPGDPLNQQTLDEDIKRLYGTGFFTDASAEVRPYRDGVLVRFHIQERPLVTSVVITGNRNFRETKIRETLKTKEQELLDRRELKQDLERIKQLYRTKGFYLAEVSQEVKVDDATNRATVYMTLIEGRKIRVRRIVVEGNKAVSSRRLRKAMATKQAWGWLSAGYYRPEVLEEDLERIKQIYRSEGYSDAQASSETSFDETKRWLTVRVKVEEGARYLVGEVGLRGTQAVPEEQLREKIKLTEGKPFSQDRLFEDVARIQSVYFGQGYMAASVEHSTALNPKTQRVDITYRVIEGSIAYVGDIIVRGNVKTRDMVIRRELKIYPGERFDGEKLRRSKERLYNLGFFEEVSLETVPSKQPDQRDLVVSVKESKTGEFSFGGGYSSVDAFIGFAEIVQRNFDLFNWPTFVGGGQELKFRVMAGTRRRNFELSFTEPWIFNHPYSFGFDLFNTTRTKGEGYSFELERIGGALRLGHSISDYDRLGLTYRLEDVKVSDVSESASSALKDEVGENLLSSVRLFHMRDKRDNVFNPKSGYFLENGIELAGTGLGGDKDFWKWTFVGSVYFQPIVENQVFEMNLRMGLADPLANSETVPIFERFFAGGSESIRGYKERRVGPKDPLTRDPIGGDSMAVFNAEYTVPVADFLKAATFVDVGNVWSRIGDFLQDGLKTGVGAGVRIKTPFGPVKLDYGWPINPDRDERKTGRLHFSASRAF